MGEVILLASSTHYPHIHVVSQAQKIVLGTTMEIVSELSTEQELENWPLGHVNPQEGPRRLTLEPLIYDKPKPIAMGNRPQPHVELKKKVEIEEKVEKPNREKIIAQQKRIIQLKDLQQFKEQVSQVINEEQFMQREGHARTKMTTSIMVQCLKMIDLFEERCEYLDTLDLIEVKTSDMGKKLDEKNDNRTDLEGQNEVLRKEISKLQTTLHNTRESTNAKVRKQGKLMDEMKEMKENYASMMKIAENAKLKMGVLKSAMSEAEKSMESSIKEMPSVEAL